MHLDLSTLELSTFTMLGMAVVFGFYAAYGARRIKLPSIIGYMAVGIVLGPSLLHMFDDNALERFSFITEMALGFVAFSIGSELNMTSLKRMGRGIVFIILAESISATAVVAIAVYVLTRDLPMALVFGAMAAASAPAGTVAVIQEYRAKGNLTKALYAVVGFDDGVAIVIFAFAAALAKSLLISEVTGSAGTVFPAMWVSAKEVVLSLVVGGTIGFVFCQMVRRVGSSRDILVIMFASVFVAIGLSLRWHLSLILTNLAVGFMLANLRSEAAVRRIMAPLMDVMPLVFILFFFLAGAHLKLAALPSLGTLGIVYIIGRTVGKLGGARIGATLGRVEEKLKKYVGLGILSQAGVAIGLALIVKHEFAQLAAEYNIERALHIGTVTLTTITASCIFFEIIGPICAKIAIEKAGEITVQK